MIYPKFPQAGDVLGICAPSAGVGDKLESFDLSIDTLRSCDFFVSETESVRRDAYPSASAEKRGAEFNSIYGRDDVSAVICAAGGDYVMEMLPYIDQEVIKSKPKWFVGYSDPTSIEMLMTTKLDIATIYGVNAGAWDWRPLHEYQINALRVLSGELPEQHSYERYSASGYNEETGIYEMDGEVRWELFKPKHGSLQPTSSLEVTGRLIGGCIDVIDWVIGTPFEDLEGFAARYADDGLIWFFDNFEMNPLQLMYTMIKMRHKGLFDNAKAVVFGRTFLPGEATDYEYLEKLERVFAAVGVPVIWNADIGHTKPSFTIINGAVGHLHYDHGVATLRMELK